MAEMSYASTADIQLFRGIFNASPIGIAVETLDGKPLFVNPAFCSFLGFSEQDLRNKHCVDFSPGEDAEKDWALLQRLKAGEIDHYQLEKRYFRRDGSLIWGRLSISLLNGRESPLILAMVENITDKRNAEEALRASRHCARVKNGYAWPPKLERCTRMIGMFRPIRWYDRQSTQTCSAFVMAPLLLADSYLKECTPMIAQSGVRP